MPGMGNKSCNAKKQSGAMWKIPVIWSSRKNTLRNKKYSEINAQKGRVNQFRVLNILYYKNVHKTKDIIWEEYKRKMFNEKCDTYEVWKASRSQ